MRRLSPIQLQQVLERLLSETAARKTKWNSTVPGWYFADGKRFSYAIASRDRDDVHPFDFRIYSLDDDSDILVENSSDDPHLDQQPLDSLMDLYLAARRSQESADDLFLEILNDLNDLDEQDGSTEDLF